MVREESDIKTVRHGLEPKMQGRNATSSDKNCFAALHVRLCTVMYGYVRLCTVMHGYVRLCTAMHGYVRLCTAKRSFRFLIVCLIRGVNSTLQEVLVLAAHLNISVLFILR